MRASMPVSLLVSVTIAFSLHDSAIASSLTVGEFEPSCTSKDDFGWPRFNDASELAAEPSWSKYFSAVYGEMPPEAFPVCTYGE